MKKYETIISDSPPKGETFRGGSGYPKARISEEYLREIAARKRAEKRKQSTRNKKSSKKKRK